MRDPQRLARRFGDGDGAFAFLDGSCKRVLGQNVFAVFQRVEDDFAVRVVVGGDDHTVDVVAGVRVAPVVEVRDAARLGDGSTRRLVARRDGDQFGVIASGDELRVALSHPARSDDGDS